MYEVRIDRMGGTAFESNSMLVYLLERHSHGSALHTYDGRVLPLVEAARVADHSDHYWAKLPMDAAHALLGELARTLGAVEHPEQLRRDYEHERGRVDKLMDYLMTRALE